MSNLISLNLTYNQLGNTLHFSDFLNCLIPWKIVDLSHNYLTTFPSTLFRLNRFDSVYLNDNQLTSIDLSIVALVQVTVDLRNNKITSTINPTNFTISLDLQTGDTVIVMGGNSMLELNDGIYEMYGSCEELQRILVDTHERPSLTVGLGNIDFGTTQVNCSCDQYYIVQMLNLAFGTPVLGRISSLLCANVPVNFVNYICSLEYSTVNFTKIKPRLCQLDDWNMTAIMKTTSTSTTSTETTTLTITTVTTSSTTSTETTTSTTTTTSTQTRTSTTTTTSTQTTTSTTTTTSTQTTTSTTTTTSTQTTTSTTTTTSTQTTTSTTTTTSTQTTTSTTTTTSTQTTTSTTTTTSTQTTKSTTTTTSTQTTTSTTTTTSTQTTTSTTTTTSTQTTTSTTTTTSTQTTTSTTTTTSTQTTTSTTTTTSTQTTTSTTTTTSTQTTTSTTTTTSTQTTTSTTTTTSTQTTTSTTTTTSTQTTTSTTTTTSTQTTTSTTTTTSTQTTTSTTTTTSTQTTTSTTTTTSTKTTTSTTTTTSTETTTSTSSTVTTVTTSISTTAMTSISTVNTSTCLATFSISNTNLLLTCPSNANFSLLPINNYTLTFLDRITSLRIEGYNGARGPLQTIPPNICFLTKLQVLNISFNRLDHLNSSFLSSNPSCLETLRILDMTNNYLNEFPSLFLTKTINLQRLFLQNNQLISFDLALFAFVSTSINLSNNQISKLTNNANINLSNSMYSLETSIDLTNNSQIIDLTDAIYEMYGTCYEIYQIFNNSIPSKSPTLTISLLNINFGTSKINCTCNQYYIQKSLIYSIGNNLPSTYPLSNALCTNGQLFYNNNNTAICSASSVNFPNTRPRLCTIKSNDGNIILVNTTDNIPGVYPYYLTQTMNNSYCLFTFYIGGKRVSIDCINGSSLLTEISLSILNNIYFRNITQVLINNQNSLSQIPFYLCSLPSTSIDLSNQSFLILDQNTFPCLSNTTLKYINLSYNQINIINLTLFNWILIDLTSNNLTQLPYTLLNSNQNRQLSPQRNLLLQFNKITQFDLFIYTYINIYINLQNNPFLKTINGYNILNNYQKKSLRNGPISTNIILPNQIRFLLNDEIAQNYNTCDSRSLNYLIEIFQYMKNNNIIIEIQCECSSIYIKEYFYLFNSSDKLTNRFLCSNLSSLTIRQFESLTETDCLSNIMLSSNRLCQFARIRDSSLSNSPISSDNNRLLAIVLGSVLGSLGFLLILALLIGVICYKRRSSTQTTHISRLSRVPYTNNNPPETHWPYDSSPRIFQKRRRRPREPPIDYNTNSCVFRIENPTSLSSNV